MDLTDREIFNWNCFCRDRECGIAEYRVCPFFAEFGDDCAERLNEAYKSMVLRQVQRIAENAKNNQPKSNEKEIKTMSCGYSNRNWACPFFVRDEKQKVICEGGGPAFEDPRRFNDFVSEYCANVPGWNNCTLARALKRQYERDEEG